VCVCELLWSRLLACSCCAACSLVCVSQRKKEPGKNGLTRRHTTSE
jgi:hypothetical protein